MQAIFAFLEIHPNWAIIWKCFNIWHTFHIIFTQIFQCMYCKLFHIILQSLHFQAYIYICKSLSLYILARHKIKLKCTLYIAFVKCCMFSIEFAVPLFQRHEKKKRWPQYKRQNFINNVIIVYDIDISPRVDIIYGGILIEVNGRLKKIIHFFIPHYFRKCRTV